MGDRRWVARGGAPGTVGDIAVWAVPFGLVGARLYHVVTDPELYFSAGKNPWAALYIWEGGLGIWGAIAMGCLGGYIACRRKGISFLAIADALAPGIAIAQAIGRWGNYFNQELYGRPSSLPWAVEIDPSHRESGMEQYSTYQPTFLYESIWDLGVAGLVIWAERRFKLGYGRAFALYVMAYCVGRVLDRVPADRHGQPPLRGAGQRVHRRSCCSCWPWPSSSSRAGGIPGCRSSHRSHEASRPTVEPERRVVGRCRSQWRDGDREPDDDAV